MKHIILILIAGAVLVVGLAHADSGAAPGVGAGFEGSIGMSQIQILTAPGATGRNQTGTTDSAPQAPVPVTKAEQPSANGSVKGRKYKKKVQTYEEFVIQRKKSQPVLPSEEEFAKLAQETKVYAQLQSSLLALDYKAFKEVLTDMNKTELKADTKKAVKKLKVPPQGAFKKIALARIAQQSLDLLLENGIYEDYTDAMSGSKLVLNKEDFRLASSRLKKHKATIKALLADNYEAFATARKAEQPVMPSKEQFEKMQESSKKQ